MKRTPLKRKTPLKSKRSTPRRKPPVTCAILRCSKRPTVTITSDERYCNSHATKIADKLVGDFVKARDGYRCQLTSFNHKPCYQPEAVYWCHVIPKGRYYGTRWEPDNAVTGCAGHHKAFDTAPLEKDDWAEAWLGTARFEELQQIAKIVKGVDVAEVIRRYRLTSVLDHPPDRE